MTPPDTAPLSIPPRRLDPTLRKLVIAFGALTEPTVLRWERGLPIKPATAARIARALREATAFLDRA